MITSILRKGNFIVMDNTNVRASECKGLENIV